MKIPNQKNSILKGGRGFRKKKEGGEKAGTGSEGNQPIPSTKKNRLPTRGGKGESGGGKKRENRKGRGKESPIE